ncbi:MULTISPECIES: coproporphyrinogen-III oxidase family protein [Acetivibrio]|uniref:Heme chaperone HemW n=1 Tax=Acetivibrio straminisolvens JCM 21531 TaxID=1294263 RepID=W4V6Q9_9FIRM|nr:MULTISPECIES: coproporphyrinogen-III oxidase family protein [Acetivibrio]GAE88498.1 hypothetical protein JCM21531_1943 [Acetivibrio straminisolvens JCM 21531]
MNKVNFRKSLTPLYVYPKICKYSDIIEDAESFLKPLNDGDIGENNELLVYIHIPFCKNLCLYCSYYKEPLHQYTDNVIEELIESYIKEIEMYANFGFFRNKVLKAIQIGGGTPTDIDTKLIVRLIDTVKAYFGTSQCELIGMEGNAATLQNLDSLKNLQKAGVSKISFGVQTFNEELRKKLNIKTKIDDIYSAAYNIKLAGINQIAVDLMINLPDQTEEQLLEDAQKIVAIDPDYIDVYGLNVFPNTRFKKILDGKTLFEEFPDDMRYLKAYQTIKRELLRYGYQQVMVFTYAKPGLKASIYERLFFSSNLLGIGPSSRSYLSGISFRNVSSVDGYLQSISKGKFPIECGNYASENEKDERKVVFFPNLLKCKKYDGIEKWEKEFNYLIKKGLVKELDDCYVLTDEGCLWPGNISRMFFSDEQIRKHNVSFFQSVINKDNPYNQDKMGI